MLSCSDGVCHLTADFSGPYTSCRLKISSFSRHGHLAQPRQQTSKTATPTVTIKARRLPLVTSQCIKLCITTTFTSAL